MVEMPLDSGIRTHLLTTSPAVPRTGETSFTLALLVAASTVLFSHGLLYFLIAAAFNNFVLEPLFSATFFSGVVFVVLAGVLYRATLSSQRKHNRPLDVSTGKTVSWTFLLVLVLSMIFGLIFVVTELEGFGIQFVWFGLIHAIPALLLTLVTSALGIRLHRNKWDLDSKPS